MTTISTTRIVIDAYAVVAMLADVGLAGEWATSQAVGAQLTAPELMPYEAGNILRRHVLTSILDVSAATFADGDLTALPIDLCSYAVLAERAWALRNSRTIYDAGIRRTGRASWRPSCDPRCSTCPYAWRTISSPRL